MRFRWAALALVLLAGCGAPAAAPEPEPSPTVTITDVQDLAFELAFFEAQGDSGLAVAAALNWESKTGCRTGYVLAYWQEDQRGEEVIARAAAHKELSQTYQYVVGATRDAMLTLHYTSVTGEELDADFIGLVLGANC